MQLRSANAIQAADANATANATALNESVTNRLSLLEAKVGNRTLLVRVTPEPVLETSLNGRKVRCFVTITGNEFVNDEDKTEEYDEDETEEYDEDAYDEDDDGEYDENEYYEENDKDELNENAKRTKRKKPTKARAKKPKTTKSNKSTLPSKRKERIVPANAVLPTQITAVTEALLAKKNTPTLCKELAEMLHSAKAMILAELEKNGDEGSEVLLEHSMVGERVGMSVTIVGGDAVLDIVGESAAQQHRFVEKVVFSRVSKDVLSRGKFGGISGTAYTTKQWNTRKTLVTTAATYLALQTGRGLPDAKVAASGFQNKTKAIDIVLTPVEMKYDSEQNILNTKPKVWTTLVPGVNGAIPLALKNFRRIVLTGTFDELVKCERPDDIFVRLGYGKAELTELIETFGGSVSKNITRGTDLVVAGNMPGRKKISQACRDNIPYISFESLCRLLKGKDIKKLPAYQHSGQWSAGTYISNKKAKKVNR